MSKLPWILGGLAGSAVLLFGGRAAAAPAKKRVIRSTLNEDKFNIAMQRLSGFISAARIDAKAYRIHKSEGLMLGVQPGAKFVVEDARALPMEVDGLDVLIKGWPR